MKVANGTAGNFSTAANWDTVTNTPTIHAATDIALTSGNVFTATFTAPNTSNKSTGVALYINLLGTSGTIVVTLQESSVDTTATASINLSSLSSLAVTSGNWVYFRFASPYTFTTTSAGTYRFRVTMTSPVGSTTVAADSGGSLVAYIATDNRNVAPVAGEDAMVIAPNAGSAFTITMDGTQSIGSTGTTGILPTSRTVSNALYVGYNGVVSFDAANNSDLTVKGSVYINNLGTLTMGTIAIPIPSTYTTKLHFNENGTSNNYQMYIATQGSFIAQGAPKPDTSLWKTTYVSGTGTVGSPFITTDAVNWSVGDEIIVCAASNTGTNFNENESRFIITVNSTTSYVLSATSGGAAAALTFTHAAGADVVNVQRNVLITSTDTTHGWSLTNACSTVGNVALKWARFTTSTNITMLAFNTQGVISSIGNIDYCVSYGGSSLNFAFNTGSIAQTYTGLISYGNTGGAGTAGLGLDVTASNQTFVDCYVLWIRRFAVWIHGSNNTFTRLRINAADYAGFAGASGLMLSGGNSNTFNNCTIDCCNVAGLILQSSGNVFNSLVMAGKGTNIIDILCPTGAYNNAIFSSSTFSSATFVSSYLNQSVGSVIAFSNLSGTTYSNRWYTSYGVAYTTGAGLTDTNVRTAGTYNVRLSPENQTNGFIYSYYKAVNATSAISVLGFIQLNAALTGDSGSSCIVNLYLPGNQAAGATPDATTTMTKGNNNYNAYVIGANYVGAIPGLARIDIVVKGLATEYAYVADLDNGSNSYTNFKIWLNGQPSSIMPETLGDAVAIWSVATSSLTTTGTTGNQVKKLLTTGKFIALK